MAESGMPPPKIRKVNRSDFISGVSPEAKMSFAQLSQLPEAPTNSEEKPALTKSQYKRLLHIQRLEPVRPKMSSAQSSPPRTQSPEAVQSSPTNGEAKPVLSKTQQKRLLKAQRWEAGKETRRIQRREKHKAKLARKVEQKEMAQELGLHEDDQPDAEAQKKTLPRRPIQTPIGMILDCDFDELMSEKEIISLGAQVTRCYSENKNAPYRAHMAVSSFGGRMKERFETVLTRNHENWKGVTFHEDNFMAAAEKLNAIMQGPEGGELVGALDNSIPGVEKGAENGEADEGESKEEGVKGGGVKLGGGVKNNDESTILNPTKALKNKTTTSTKASSRKRSRADTEDSVSPEATTAEKPALPPTVELKPISIVYLTSDSEEILTKLEPNTSYVIGGIVDKNRYKGLCYRRARARGIRTAKLPIAQYMTMAGRSVLAVNHVMEIMLKWLDTGDWGEAFLSVIPKRKEAKLKVKNGGPGEESKDGEDEDKEDDAGNANPEYGVGIEDPLVNEID